MAISVVPWLVLLSSSTPITLNEVRTESRKNTEVLLAQWARDGAAAQSLEARSSILPRIQLDAVAGSRYQGRQLLFTIAPVFDASGNPVVDAGGNPTFEQRVERIPQTSLGIFTFSASLSQLLLDGGRWWNRIAQGDRLEEASQAELEEQQNLSEFEGIRRFYELYRAQKQREVLAATFTRSEEQRTRALAVYQAGRTSKAEYYSAQTNAGNDEVALIRQDTTVAAARARLSEWLLRPADLMLTAVTRPEDEKSVPLRGDLAQLLETARTKRPLLRALQRRTAAAEAGVAVARSSYFPAVSGQLAYVRDAPAANPFFTDLSQQNAFLGQVLLSWNLFAGFETVAQVRQAQSAAERAHLEEAQARRELELRLGVGISTLRTLEKALEVTRRNSMLAEQGLELAVQRFRAGAGSTLEVRDAQLKLTQADLSVVETLVDLRLAYADLVRTTGEIATAP